MDAQLVFQSKSNASKWSRGQYLDLRDGKLEISKLHSPYNIKVFRSTSMSWVDAQCKYRRWYRKQKLDCYTRW